MPGWLALLFGARFSMHLQRINTAQLHKSARRKNNLKRQMDEGNWDDDEPKEKHAANNAARKHVHLYHTSPIYIIYGKTFTKYYHRDVRINSTSSIRKRCILSDMKLRWYDAQNYIHILAMNLLVNHTNYIAMVQYVFI